MDDKDNLKDQNINITIPVVIGYSVLDTYLKKTLVGEIIDKENKEGEKSKYAKILDVSIEKSYLEGYDLLLNISLQTLTSFFRNREVKILFHAALELNQKLQHVSLKKFEIDGKTKSWFADKLLETVVNNWMYEKLKKKMNFDLMPHIEEKVGAINTQLINKIEAREGVHLIGVLDKVEISKLRAGENELWISVSVNGTGLLELESLDL